MLPCAEPEKAKNRLPWFDLYGGAHAFPVLAFAVRNLATAPQGPGILHLRATGRLATCRGSATNLFGHGHYHDRGVHPRPGVLFRASGDDHVDGDPV